MLLGVSPLSVVAGGVGILLAVCSKFCCDARKSIASITVAAVVQLCSTPD